MYVDLNLKSGGWGPEGSHQAQEVFEVKQVDECLGLWRASRRNG